MITALANSILSHPYRALLGCFGSIPIIEWVM